MSAQESESVPRRAFGSTGLHVSVMGVGAGGPSRLGTRGDPTEQTADAAVELISAALDRGVNLIDTATTYGTQKIVGRAVEGRRDDVVICTKHPVVRWDTGDFGPPLPADEFEASIDTCLEELGIECVDVFFAHGVRPEDYEHTLHEIVPVLERAKQAGKCRFIGVTEAFAEDTTHAMLDRAIDDDWMDVTMVGFNLLNHTARDIFRRTTEKGVATLGMFAVRRAMSKPERLREVVAGLIESGEVDRAAIDPEDPLGFLGDTAAIIDAAYRFCIHEPGLDCVLAGTGSMTHLEANLASASSEMLPREMLDFLRDRFARVGSACGH